MVWCSTVHAELPEFESSTRYKQVENINTRMFTDNNMQCFVEELEEVDWHQVFDHDTTADPIIT